MSWKLYASQFGNNKSSINTKQFEQPQKQQFQDNNQINNQNLLKIINKVEQLLETFEKYLAEGGKQLNTFILVGVTGSGKSTLFNFLAGYQLQMSAQSNNLALKAGENGSPISEGNDSQTKEPYYYYHYENNHLLIDFPGFEDTEGIVTQAIVTILLNRIVKRQKIKMGYVQYLSGSTLPNRGTQLQTFFNQYFHHQQQDFHNTLLILNQYRGKDQFDELQSKLQDEVQKKCKQKEKNQMFVIKEMKDDQDLKNSFTPLMRRAFWQTIEKQKPILMKPYKFDGSEEISIFISEMCLKLTKKTVDAIELKITKDIEKLAVNVKKELIEMFIEMEIIISVEKTDNIIGWYNRLMQQCSKILNYLKCNNLADESQVCSKIFNFFAKQEEILQIEGILLQNSALVKALLTTQRQTLLDNLSLDPSKKVTEFHEQMMGSMKILIERILNANNQRDNQYRLEMSKLFQQNQELLKKLDKRPCSIF